jgi:hypothetical protein
VILYSSSLLLVLGMLSYHYNKCQNQGIRMNKFNQKLMEIEIPNLNLKNMLKQLEIHGSFFFNKYNRQRFLKGRNSMKAFMDECPDGFAHLLCTYSSCVLKCRWLKAEPFILTSVFWSYIYAENVVKGKWKEVETVLIGDARYACSYATVVTGERFLEAERLIFKCKQFPELWENYSKHFEIEASDIGKMGEIK